jgi:TonB family protein
MMSNKTSKSSHLLKLLALLPIVGVTLALNAETVKDYVYDEPQKQVPVKKGKINGTIKYNSNTTMQVVEAQDQKEAETPKAEQQKEFKVEGTYTSNEQKDVPQDVFDVVEVMPQFPGGAPKLFEYLSQNIRYPKEAMESNTQGRVIVSFVVCKDGSICDAKVVKSVSPALDAEGLRVISSMPNWTPGTQSGKAVNVKYTVPISFRLDGNKTDNAVKKEDPKVINHSIIRLDGQNGKAPMVILDGKEVSSEVLKSISPDNIESISVLKDNAATKAYGEKAKDGVLIITTKKK